MNTPQDDPRAGSRQPVLWFAGGAAVLLIVIALVAVLMFSSEFGRKPDRPPLLPSTTLHETPTPTVARTPPPDNAPPSPVAAAASAPASAASAASASAGAQNGAAAVAQGAAEPAAHKAGFTPPAEREIPAGPMGDVIRQGEQIFLHTAANAKGFVGNSLNCVNCHLDAGRRPDSAPLWGAYVSYPAYRSKTKEVDTFASRLRGCFMYSMNGKAPPEGGPVLVALESYAYWLAKGAPTGEKLPGAGYPKVPKPPQAPDIERGRAVFAAQCALCHGADGQGQRAGDTQVYPPLWGARSFNWGAGMAGVDKAAGFIKANMPFSKANTLTDQEAWDVAQFMDAQERPQDPRFDGNIASTRKKFHDSEYSLYGQTVNGKLLGQGTPAARR